MIANICTLLLVVSSAMAFSSVSTRARSMTMMAEKSKALPFLARPEKVSRTFLCNYVACVMKSHHEPYVWYYF